MKKLCLLILIAIPSYIFSQNTTVNFIESNGEIGNIYVLESNIVFQYSTDGLLKEIIIFDDESSANEYIKTPHKIDITPSHQFNESGVVIKIDKVTSISYYETYRGGQPSIKNGKIAQVGTYSIDYIEEYYGGKASVNNGKISKIGSIKIDYFEKYSGGQPSVKNGKVSQIGTCSIDYIERYYGGRASINNGKISKVGSIKIDYFEKYSGGQPSIKNEKVSKIGNYSIDYVEEYYGGKASINNGKLKYINGQDSRVIII